MVTRTYICVVDGAFSVKRAISAPTDEVCPLCRLSAKQTFLVAPVMGMTGNGIPDSARDMKEYEGWQRDTWKKAEDKYHVDNMGHDAVSPKKTVEKHTFGNG